jgi:short-subunit dehydrogenase
MTRVLITGATSGLGLALAKNFHAQGADLVLVGRTPLSELPTFFHVGNYCQADLAQPEAVVQVRDFIAQHDIHNLDVVIHNAAVGYYGDVRAQSDDNIKTLLEVNLHAPLALTHGLLEPLKAAHGRLVFISSLAADMPAPDYAVYSASKAALDGLARNLSVEFQGAFRVQVIHPGATRTAMHRKSGVPEGHFDISRFAAPENVATEIIRAIHEDRFDVTIGRGNRILRFLGRHFGGVLETIMRWRKRRQAKHQPHQSDPDTAVAETPEPLTQAAMRVAHNTTNDAHEQALDVTPASAENKAQDDNRNNGSHHQADAHHHKDPHHKDPDDTQANTSASAEDNSADAQTDNQTDITDVDTDADIDQAQKGQLQKHTHNGQNHQEGVKESS